MRSSYKRFLASIGVLSDCGLMISRRTTVSDRIQVSDEMSSQPRRPKTSDNAVQFKPIQSYPNLSKAIQSYSPIPND